ncbi:rplA [Symbiodinium sp. KB8]|nr:rplA [Symbiodinium sp. KB8]
MARRVAARAASAQVMPICAACAPVDALWRPQRSFAAQAKKAGGSKKRKKAWSIKKRTGYGYSVDAALHLVQSMATARFDETVELALQLGVDPRKPGQAIRGVVQLPHGTGKSVKVAVFARGAKAEEAAAAGADIVGAEDLVASIQAGEWSFDKAVATPDMMAVVGKVARILGPRGLMPNPKLGTVTQDVASAVSAAKAGQVEYRVERNGIVHAGVGKASFPRWQLRDNLRAFMLALVAAKPETMKGVYLRHASLASTQGRGVNVDMATLDPSKGLFMRESDDVVAELAAAASAGPVGQTVSEGR